MIIVYFIPDTIHNINQSCINVRFALYLCVLNMSSNKMERKKQNKAKNKNTTCLSEQFRRKSPITQLC